MCSTTGRGRTASIASTTRGTRTSVTCTSAMVRPISNGPSHRTTSFVQPKATAWRYRTAATAIVPCDASRRQRWYATDGLIKPQGFRLSNNTWTMRLGFCLDALQPDGRLNLYGCHGALNQKFSASFLPTVREDVVEIAGPWRRGVNCLDYDYSNGVAYIYECHGQWNQRWRSTASDELRVGPSMCLEYEASTLLVFVRTCTGATNQQWLVRDDKLLQAKGTSNRCLNAPYPATKLLLAACDPSKVTQQFTSSAVRSKTRSVLKVDGPQKESLNCVDYAWGTELAYVYGCHGEANQLWEFTVDEQIRTADNKCLEFDGEGLEKVSARTCNAQLATQRWKVTAARNIVPRGYFSTSGVWRSPPKCLDVALEDAKLHLWDCTGGNNQKFRSEVFPVRNRDYVFADGAAAVGSNCLRGSNGLVGIGKCGSTSEMLWEYLPSNGTMRLQMGSTDGSNDQCLTADVGSNKVTTAPCNGLATQRWVRTANGEIALQASALVWNKCVSWTSTLTITLGQCSSTGSAGSVQKFSSVVFDGVVPSTNELTPLYESANKLSEAVKTDLFLTSNVLSQAAVVVTAAATILTSATPPTAQRATEFLTQLLTKSENVTKPVVKTRSLYLTSESEEFLLTLSMLLQGDAAEATAVLKAMEPALQSFSDQLLEARYEVLLDHVLQNDTSRLEAYTDGTLSDFDQVGGILSTVCDMSTTAKAKSLSMCRLASYFTLIDQFFVLKYKLLVDGARGITQATRDQASKVAKIFTDNQSQFQKDPLWTRLMTLLVFGMPYVDVLPAQMLAKASDSHAFLPTFVLYTALGTNPSYMAAIDPMVRFLSDQITTFHINNILKMVTDQDTDALELYLAEPFGGFRAAAVDMSDFPVMALHVAPLVCSDESRLEELSLCRLQDFHSGLKSVVNFERVRRSNDVSLENLLEVDVRKKLDVLNDEKSQYETLSKLENVANQIGSTLIQGLSDLKTQMAASTAAIRGDIENSRQDLRAAIGTMGQTLQDSIQTSTQTITKEVGEKAASIRGDIYESTRQLAERLDDTGRAILGKIEESKQELKYQIGETAQETRRLIAEKTDELKTHMSQEVNGLREFIDVKTNEVIGVVHEEGKLTRESVDKATDQIVRVVEKEGAITRAYVDTKTKEIKETVTAESERTREFIDIKTNQVIRKVHEEAQETRAFIDEKGNQVIGFVKEEGDKTRREVRAEAEKTREHITNKTEEIKGVVRQEGEKTRTEITKATIELKNHVTNQTNSVKERVSQAQTAIVAKTEQQFKNLTGQISAVGVSMKNLSSAVAVSNAFIADMNLAECKAFEDAHRLFKNARAVVVGTATTILTAVQNDIHTSSVLESTLSALCHLFLGRVKLYSPWSDEGGQFIRFDPEDDGPERDPDQIINAHKAIWQIFTLLNLHVSKTWTTTYELTTNTSTSITDFSIDYAAYFYEYRKIEIMLILNYYEPETEANEYYNLKMQLERLYAGIDQMRSSLVTAATAGTKCESAKKAKASASTKTKSRLRSLQTTMVNPNEPYHTMIYSTLTKVILDYRIQEAAFQFCKYYEFKNGGVAPPMCGSASQTKIHYTMAQIQDMRSWQPVAQRRLTTRVLLPTQRVIDPTTQQAYPFVDLRALQAGSSVLFTPATWDLEWLKKNRWVLSNTKVETFPSYYVESIRLFLPVQTNDTTGAASTASFAVTATMESMPDQFPSWALRARKYKLPAQSFVYDTIYGEPFCVDSNVLTNPYHKSVGCAVADDIASQLCALNGGNTGNSAADTQRMLLPSLFATWRISADFDRSSPLYQLVVPPLAINNTSPVPEMKLFADVTLLQAATQAGSSTTGSGASIMATTTCCAADEYKNTANVCTKCPAGTKSALNGYTCSSI